MLPPTTCLFSISLPYPSFPYIMPWSCVFGGGEFCLVINVGRMSWYSELTVCRDTRRDVSWYLSWRVVMLVVTCRHTRRDVSWYLSWRVVVLVVTCRDFPTNETLSLLLVIVFNFQNFDCLCTLMQTFMYFFFFWFRAKLRRRGDSHHHRSPRHHRCCGLRSLSQTRHSAGHKLLQDGRSKDRLRSKDLQNREKRLVWPFLLLHNLSASQIVPCVVRCLSFSFLTLKLHFKMFVLCPFV